MKAENGKFKLLFVGLEGLERWPGNPGFEPVGIVDLYGEVSGNHAVPLWRHELRNCTLYADLDAALSETGNPDIAVISVPGHAKTTIFTEAELLRRGIVVLAKKLRLGGMSDVDALKMACLQANGNAVLYVGEHYRYLPQVRMLRKLIADGHLGAVSSVSWRCLLPYECADWMKGYRHLALEDLAYHHFGVLHYLLGLHLYRVFAQSFEPSYSKTGTRTSASALMETMEGYRLNYQTVWCSKRKPFGYLGEVLIEGEKCSALLTEEGLSLYSYFGRKRRIACGEPVYRGPWGALDHWLDTQIEGVSNLAADSELYTFEQIEPALRALYSTVESAETGDVLVSMEEERFEEREA